MNFRSGIERGISESAMGTRHLDRLAATPKWRRVIALLGDGAGRSGLPGVGPGVLSDVADATLDASLLGLQRAKGDEGLAYSLYLMVQATQAARESDFVAALSRAGLSSAGGRMTGLPDATTVVAESAEPSNVGTLDLLAAFTRSVDRHLRQSESRTDIGEMAQLAAAESIASLCTPQQQTIFSSPSQELQKSLRQLSTEAGFGRLVHDFFSRLTRRYLEYHLSRELSNHVGPGRRFATALEHNAFLRELDAHCRKSTEPVRQFAGEWYSKHIFQRDVTTETTKGFASHALDKVWAVLKHGGGRDAR
jgi:hypothetical protein